MKLNSAELEDREVVKTCSNFKVPAAYLGGFVTC